MLQINLVIEDAKISLDELQEDIQEIEEYCQSTDVAGELRYQVLCCTADPSHAKALNGHHVFYFLPRYSDVMQVYEAMTVMNQNMPIFRIHCRLRCSQVPTPLYSNYWRVPARL